MGRAFEWLFDRIYGVEPLVEGDPDMILRVAFQSYRGRAFTLSDGTEVRPGCRVVELHQDNERLAGLHRQYDDLSRVGFQYLRMFRASIRALARAWQNDPRFEGVVAAHGTNIFHETAPRAGFDVRPLEPALKRAIVGWHIRRLVAGAHPQGRQRVMLDGRPRQAMEMWISRSMCVSRHGGHLPTSGTGQEFSKRHTPKP